jgi:hypothetical protein
MRITMFLVGCTVLLGCGAANVTDDPDRNLRAYERAVPPARTSMDETDGPTAPQGAASRPPAHEEEE